MRIAFFMNAASLLQFYDETIDALLADGHEVLLGIIKRTDAEDSLKALEGRRRPRILKHVPRRSGREAELVHEVRRLIDFARYLDPRFAHIEWFRDKRRLRMRNASPLSRLLARFDTLPAPVARAIMRALVDCERALPSDPSIEDYLRGLEPDVVLVTPLVMGSTVQNDLVKSARALGIPCAACIASWDNLSSKGLISELPDRVIVWNDTQRREAIELHGVPGDRVITTGAQTFDRWFGRRPTASREEFCRRVGLDPERPYVLFAGSVSRLLPGADEDAFVRRWAEAVRSAPDPRLAGAGILFRPHPRRRGDWAGIDFSDIGDAVVWPPERPNYVVPAARGEYFDAIFHSAALAGINTSAMVDAAIIGRPALAVRRPEFELIQDGSVHFSYLLPENGGPLSVTSTLDEHVRDLAAALADPEPVPARHRAFVASFIRPHGIDEPATRHLVRAITDLAAVTPAPRPAGASPLPPRLPLELIRMSAKGPSVVATEALVRALGRAQDVARRLERAGLPAGGARRALQRAGA